MALLWDYVKVFLVGGALCVIGQLLIDYTRLTPARILTGFVVAGVVLGALGIYGPLAEWAGAGATVPLTGFGWNLAKGVKKAVEEQGLLGVFTGGFQLCPVKVLGGRAHTEQLAGEIDRVGAPRYSLA